MAGDEAEVRAAATGLKLSELRKRARAAGVDADAVDEAVRGFGHCGWKWKWILIV
jgi:hypothetical protein